MPANILRYMYISLFYNGDEDLDTSIYNSKYIYISKYILIQYT